MAMTDTEKLAMTKTLLDIEATDTAQDVLIGVYLSAAAQEILSWRYSYGSEEKTQVPAEYDTTQVFAVVAGFAQGGAEGQTIHSENGVSGTFKYADMIAYIRANVRPICKVV